MRFSLLVPPLHDLISLSGVSTRPSLHGVTQLTIQSGASPTTCWCFGLSFCSWMLALPGVQWKPTHVFLTQGTHVELLEKCVADSTVPIDVGIPKQAPPPDGVDWALFDGRPTRAMLQLCALAGIRRLVSLKPLRTNMGQWRSIHLNLVHHAVGGITTAHRRVFFHWDERRFFPSGLLPRDDCVLPSIPRDASTIVGTTERGRGVCKAPTQRHLDPIGPQVLRERQGRPVYHSGGWLPSVVTTATLVATPSVFLRDKAFCVFALSRVRRSWVLWGYRNLACRLSPTLPLLNGISFTQFTFCNGLSSCSRLFLPVRRKIIQGGVLFHPHLLSLASWSILQARSDLELSTRRTRKAN